MCSRNFIKKFLILNIYITYLKDIQVNGSLTIICHATRQELNETNNMQSKEYVSYNEIGFDLDEEDMAKFHIWPRGIIPYYIDDYSFDKVLRDKIRAFLEHINRMTDLRFLELPRPPDDNSRWVFFINRQGLLKCADYAFENFTNEGVQKVVLGYDCLNTKNDLAEVFLLLVGVPPQHNAPNRNKFIKINRKNIMPEKRGLFKILKDDEWLFHELEYDFKSAGHYDTHKYTLNGGASISPKKRMSNLEIGHRDCFSDTDIKKIRMLYNYISNEQANTLLPECSKMFSPGSNFSKYQHHSKSKIIPRKKPNRYLGLPDEASEQELPDKEKQSKEVENVNNSTADNIIIHSGEESQGNNSSMTEEVIANKSEEILGENQEEQNTPNENEESQRDNSSMTEEVISNKSEDILGEHPEEKNTEESQGDNSSKTEEVISNKSEEKLGDKREEKNTEESQGDNSSMIEEVIANKSEEKLGDNREEKNTEESQGDNSSMTEEVIANKSEEKLGENREDKNTPNEIKTDNYKLLSLKGKPNNQFLLDLSDYSTEGDDYQYIN